MLDLLQASKAGDQVALRTLAEILGQRFARPFAARYRNPDIDRHEVEAIFLTELALAIMDAKLEIGDPIQFILWRARKRTISYLRIFHIDNLVVDCPKCGQAGQRLAMKNGMPVCPSCGSGDVQTDRRRVALTSLAPGGRMMLQDVMGQYSLQDTQEAAMLNMTIEDMRRYLVTRCGGPNTRVIQLFDYLIENQDPSAAITDLSESWGTSSASVWQAMRKLRGRVTEYMAAEAM